MQKDTAEFLIDPNTFAMILRNRATGEQFDFEYGLTEVKTFESREKIALWSIVHQIESEKGIL